MDSDNIQELEKKLFIREREFNDIYIKNKLLTDRFHRLLHLSNTFAVIHTTQSIEQIFDAVLSSFSKMNIEKILVVKHIENQQWIVSHCGGYSRRQKEVMINQSMMCLIPYFEEVILSGISTFFTIQDPGIQNIVQLMNIIISPIINSEKEIWAFLIVGISKDKIAYFEDFNESTVEFFSLLSAQLSIAIQKNQYFNKLQNLNEALEDKVEKRTKKLEETTFELRKAKEIAEEANQAKSQFLSVVSHELRTPLHVILGINDILIRKFLDLDDDTANRLKIVERSSKRLLNLVNDILDLNKLESGKMEKRLESIELKELLTCAYDEATSLLKNKKLEFHLDFKHQYDHLIFLSDKQKLQQVITNLLSNAYKFTDYGRVSLMVKVKNNEQLIEFSVSDTGSGISSQHLDKIFEPFYQIDGGLSRSIKGTGLGLPICKDHIELLGGKIWVTSEPSKGTTFTFQIPLIYASLQESTQHSVIDHNQHNIQNIKTKRILLCDDDEFNRSFLEMIVKDKIQYDLVGNGFMALQYAKENNYDAIFLDIQMPGMDGKETYLRLTKEIDLQKIRVFAMTAQAMKEEQLKLRQHGFTDFLLKPFTEADFMAFLLRWLG